MVFTKMHGLGNDFIVVDDREGIYQGGAQGAAALCDRHTGIGADGLVLLHNSSAADIRMDIYNSDGSIAEMCGNATRCFAKYAYENGIVCTERFGVETLSGIKFIQVFIQDGKVTSVRVDMGTPLFSRAEIPMIGSGICRMEKIRVLDREFLVSAVNTGVPHAVVFSGAMEEEDILRYGAALERDTLFPKKTNVNFVNVLDRENIWMRTFERGCGRTLACGTGASATGVCAANASLTERRVKVHLDLGTLEVEWDEDGHIYMSGPAEKAFEGRVLED